MHTTTAHTTTAHTTTAGHDPGIPRTSRGLQPRCSSAPRWPAPPRVAAATRSTGPSTKNPLGLYALMQVNTKAIPTEIKHGPFFDATVPRFYNLLIVKITGGELVLRDGGRFHFAVDFYVNGDGNEASVTRPVEGTWEVDGNELTLTPDGSNGFTTATIGKGSIRMDLDLIGDGKSCHTFQYRK